MFENNQDYEEMNLYSIDLRVVKYGDFDSNQTLKQCKDDFTGWLDKMQARYDSKMRVYYIDCYTTKNGNEFIMWLKTQLFGNGLNDNNKSRVHCRIVRKVDTKRQTLMDGYIVGH